MLHCRRPNSVAQYHRALAEVDAALLHHAARDRIVVGALDEIVLGLMQLRRILCGERLPGVGISFGARRLTLERILPLSREIIRFDELSYATACGLAGHLIRAVRDAAGIGPPTAHHAGGDGANAAPASLVLSRERSQLIGIPGRFA